MRQSGSAGFAIALALAAVTASGLAGTHHASVSPPSFSSGDKNHDGFLSRSEVPKQLDGLSAHFDQYDTNHDHRLSVAEFDA